MTRFTGGNIILTDADGARVSWRPPHWLWSTYGTSVLCGNELYTLILCFGGWQSQLNPDGTLLQTKADGA